MRPAGRMGRGRRVGREELRGPWKRMRRATPVRAPQGPGGSRGWSRGRPGHAALGGGLADIGAVPEVVEVEPVVRIAAAVRLQQRHVARDRITHRHLARGRFGEHGTMYTLALVRVATTATKEIQYLNAKGALTYTDMAGDPGL